MYSFYTPAQLTAPAWLIKELFLGGHLLEKNAENLFQIISSYFDHFKVHDGSLKVQGNIHDPDQHDPQTESRYRSYVLYSYKQNIYRTVLPRTVATQAPLYLTKPMPAE